MTAPRSRSRSPKLPSAKAYEGASHEQRRCRAEVVSRRIPGHRDLDLLVCPDPTQQLVLVARRRTAAQEPERFVPVDSQVVIIGVVMSEVGA